MSETTMRRHLIRVLRRLDARSIESPMSPGVPDVNYVGGWIELKYLKEWPKREETLVAMDHYTKEQRVWHRRRIKYGGVVWVILQVKHEWFVFRGDDAAHYLGVLDRDGLKKMAVRHFPNGLESERLVFCLINMFN